MTTPPRPTAPYEATLMNAFGKLNSEIFIFLLAYLILVIGLGVFAPGLANPLRTLLYGLPVLGIAGYLWQRQRMLVREARQHGISVTAGVTTGRARVVGVEGPAGTGALPENVAVRSTLASGDSKVGGLVAPEAVPSAQAAPASEQYLLDLFRQLDGDSRNQLMMTAMKVLEKAKRPGA